MERKETHTRKRFHITRYVIAFWFWTAEHCLLLNTVSVVQCIQCSHSIKKEVTIYVQLKSSNKSHNFHHFQITCTGQLRLLNLLQLLFLCLTSIHSNSPNERINLTAMQIWDLHLSLELELMLQVSAIALSIKRIFFLWKNEDRANSWSKQKQGKCKKTVTYNKQRLKQTINVGDVKWPIF